MENTCPTDNTYPRSIYPVMMEHNYVGIKYEGIHEVTRTASLCKVSNVVVGGRLKIVLCRYPYALYTELGSGVDRD